MKDDERAIARLLNESIDARLGPPRLAPPFRPRPASKRPARFSPLITPLLGIACVAAAVGASVGVTHLVSSGSHRVDPGFSASVPPASASDVGPSTIRTPPTARSAPKSKISSAKAGTSPATSTGHSANPHSPRPGTSAGGITFNAVDSLRLGMTAAEVAQARPDLTRHRFGTPPSCTQFFDAAAARRAGPFLAATITPPNDRVVGITAGPGDVTDRGIRVGSTKSAVLHAYADRHPVVQSSQGGNVILVQGPTSWLGFVLGSGAGDGDTVRSISVGSHDYAAQYELCAGSASS